MGELRCLENSLPPERWVPQECLKQEEDSIKFVPALLLVALSCIRPHGLQHTSLPCPSLSPGVCSNSFFVPIKVHWQQKGRETKEMGQIWGKLAEKWWDPEQNLDGCPWVGEKGSLPQTDFCSTIHVPWRLPGNGSQEGAWYCLW